MSDRNDTPTLPTEAVTETVRPVSDWAPPAFKVSGAFSSHMVLQRDEPIRVWGFSDTPGSRVAGFFAGETVTAAVGDDFRWTLTFSARTYDREGQMMVISDDRDHTVTFEDILLGDVYLIGGQSNAEQHLSACMALTPSVEFDESDNFRLFAQTQAYACERQDLCASPQPDVIHPDWCWKCPDEAASLEFSAMGWYFAREVGKYIDIPVGLVMMCAGGACLRELMPRELALGEGYTTGNLVPPGGYFNTLISPFIGLAFKGMFFYQGESEGCVRAHAEKYTYDLALLVADERARFGREFPFYNVQLCDYTSEGAKFFAFHDIVRNQQYDALSVIRNSTLTVAMDLGPEEGYADWAHSPRKLEVGERLAKLILAREYGVGHLSESGSPRPVSATLSPDRRLIVVEFTDVAAGLIVSGHNPADSYGMEVQGFTLGDYEHRTPVRATIASRHAVTVEVPAGIDEALLTHVNYAFSMNIDPETADLRGGNNLPAPAFSIKVFG